MSSKNHIDIEPVSGNNNSDEITNNRSPKVKNVHNGKSSPKVPSSLSTKSQNIEGQLNLITPLAVTEELDVEDCETESETNEGKVNVYYIQW